MGDIDFGDLISEGTMALLRSVDKFDIERKPTDHLALGVGVHGCVGQNVARAELATVLSVIADKVESIKLTGEAIWRPNNSVHALDRLPIAVLGK